MKILVTGGNGFIGSNLCQKLALQHDVMSLSRTSSSSMQINHIAYDLFSNDEYSLSKILQNIYGIVHLAWTSIPSTEDAVFDMKTNVEGTIRLMHCAEKNNVKFFVFMSSGGAVYGEQAANKPISEDSSLNPICAYGAGKAAVEKYMKSFKLTEMKTLAIRASNVYGKRHSFSKFQGIIPIFIDSIIAGRQPIIYGDGLNVRDYIYIDDMCNAIAKIIDEYQRTGHFEHDEVNIGSGIGTSINEVYQEIKMVTKTDL